MRTPTNPLPWFCLAACLSTLAVHAEVGKTPQTARPDASKPSTVLFMCPHGAAKSVLASAYFQRLAKERGLNVRVISAGTEPDAVVAPAVAAHLAKNGYQVPISTPQKVRPQDVAAADVVISMGCDLTGLPAPRGTIQKWDDVPSPSQNFSAADEAIRKRVLALVEELMQRNATRR